MLNLSENSVSYQEPDVIDFTECWQPGVEYTGTMSQDANGRECHVSPPDQMAHLLWLMTTWFMIENLMKCEISPLMVIILIYTHIYCRDGMILNVTRLGPGFSQQIQVCQKHKTTAGIQQNMALPGAAMIMIVHLNLGDIVAFRYAVSSENHK